MTHPIESLILRECELLDSGLLDDWLDLYTSDATYWIPIDENVDPLKDSSVIYDDRQRLAMRVEQIMRQKRVAQSPSSNTLHMVSNLRIEDQAEDACEARFSLLVIEVRSGDWRQQGLGESRLFPGHCTMRFTKQSDKWMIKSKTLVLLNRKQPIIGLSFLL
jgi:3-phenylpropionate/cinnamic acid dioxygenase small subunit